MDQLQILIPIIVSGFVTIIGAITSLLVKYNKSKNEQNKDLIQRLEKLENQINKISHNNNVTSESLKIYVNGNGVPQSIKDKVNDNFKKLKE